MARTGSYVATRAGAQPAALPAVDLPEQDNTSEALASLLEANRRYRDAAWPAPFDRTTHRLHLVGQP
jgi:hypothetical protein